MPSRDFIQAGGAFPFGGIDTQSPPGLIPPSSFADLVNVTLEDGVIRQRMGMEDLGGLAGEYSDSIQSNPVVAVEEFITLDGVRTLVAFTTKRQFYYDAISNEWIDITRRSDEDGDDDTRAELTGDIDDRIDVVVAVDRNRGRLIIATNGVDIPIFWDGSGNFEEVPLDNFPTDFKYCKTMEIFFNHLVIGNLKVAGFEPQSIAWSEPGDLFSFNAGRSGAALIADAHGDVVTLESFADRLVIYTERSVTVSTFIGGSSVFSFETLVHGIKIFAPRSVVSVGPFQAFMGTDNFYLFDGTRMVRPIGDLIASQLRDTLSLSYPNRSFGLSDPTRQRILWTVCTGTYEYSSTYVYVLEYDAYDMSKLKWSRFVMPTADAPTSMNTFTRAGDLRWNSPILDDGIFDDWEDFADDRHWVTRGGSEGDLLIAVGTKAGRVNTLSKSVVSDPPALNPQVDWLIDAPSTISTRIITPEITVPQDYKSSVIRILEVEFEALGNYITLYSRILTPTGNWDFLDEIALNDVPNIYRVNCDIVVGSDGSSPARGVQFRFSASANPKYFELIWYKVYFTSGGFR